MCRYGCKYKGEVCKHGSKDLSIGFMESLRQCALANKKLTRVSGWGEGDGPSEAEMALSRQSDSLRSRTSHKDDPHAE